MSNRPISNHDTPDPWLILSPLRPGLFYLTFTLGNRIEIWSSDNLESFHDNQPSLRKSVVWHPAPGTPWSADIWAPELHFLFGTWWIYAAAAPPSEGNKGHRTIVLRCTDGNRDPMNGGSWVFEGPLRGLPTHQWSIDATVFSPDPAPNMPGGRPDEQRRWYICYSGWPLGDHSDTQQDLFLARMKSPIEADESSLTCIGRAEFDWERPDHGRRGVNEGPSWVSFPGGQWRGIVYSGHGSWTCEYKLGLVQFLGGPGDDLCNPAYWRKRRTPLLVSDRDMGGPFGPGHASFVTNPADGRMYCVYHATEKDDEGWNNRKARVLYMGPDAFEEGAKTMCCAYSVCGPVRDTHGMLPGMPAGGGGPPGQFQHPQSPPPAPNQPMGSPYGQPWQGSPPPPAAGQGHNQNWQGGPAPPQRQQQFGHQSPLPPQGFSPHTSPPLPSPPQAFSHQASPPPPGFSPHTSPPPPQAYPSHASPPPPGFSPHTSPPPPQAYPSHASPPPPQAFPPHASPPPPQVFSPHASPPPQAFSPHASPPPPGPTSQPSYPPFSTNNPEYQQQYPQPYSQQQQHQPYSPQPTYPGQYQPQPQSQQQQFAPPPIPPHPNHHQQQGTGSSGSSSFDKYANEIQKRIPAQYQGYFNKAKKFLR